MVILQTNLDKKHIKNILFIAIFKIKKILYVLHLAIGLRSVSVSKPEELESYLNEGYRERTIASTNMNNYSSRAHTIATIHLLQMQASEEVSLSSQMNIVDLAGR